MRSAFPWMSATIKVMYSRRCRVRKKSCRTNSRAFLPILPMRSRWASRKRIRKAAPSGLKKQLITAAFTAALILLALIAWRLLFPPAAAEAAGMPNLAILNINNNTGDPALDDWKYMIHQMLITDLTASR